MQSDLNFSIEYSKLFVGVSETKYVLQLRTERSEVS